MVVILSAYVNICPRMAFVLILIKQWLIHDDGCGGIAIMSLYTKKYVATNTNGEFSCHDAPHFWDISKDGTGYRQVFYSRILERWFLIFISLGTKHLSEYNLCLCPYE